MKTSYKLMLAGVAMGCAASVFAQQSNSNTGTYKNDTHGSAMGSPTQEGGTGNTAAGGGNSTTMPHGGGTTSSTMDQQNAAFGASSASTVQSGAGKHGKKGSDMSSGGSPTKGAGTKASRP